MGNSIGNFENLQNPTQMLEYNRMNNLPLHLANIVFSSTKISSHQKFFPDFPRSFIDRRMERYEWLAWMWFTHETAPFIHNASVTWCCRRHSPFDHIFQASSLQLYDATLQNQGKTILKKHDKQSPPDHFMFKFRSQCHSL